MYITALRFLFAGSAACLDILQVSISIYQQDGIVRLISGMSRMTPVFVCWIPNKTRELSPGVAASHLAVEIGQEMKG
jgi:hypothetical protein